MNIILRKQQQIDNCIVIYEMLRNAVVGPHFTNAVYSIKIAEKIIDMAYKLDTSVFIFIKAQFVSLSKDFCKRVFKKPYPPFNVLVGKGAENRVQKYLWECRPIKENIPTIIEILKNDDRVAESLTDTVIPLAVSNGMISKMWLGKLLIEDRKRALKIITMMPHLSVTGEDIRFLWGILKEKKCQ